MGSSRSQGQSLTSSERTDLQTRALELRGRGGFSHGKIATALGVSPPTVKKLLQEAAVTVTQADKDRIRAEVTESAYAVKRRAWKELDRTEVLRDGSKANVLKANSHNLPVLLARVLEADDRIMRVYSLDQKDINVTVNETPSDRIRAYEESKRTGKLHEIHGGDVQEGSGL